MTTQSQSKTIAELLGIKISYQPIQPTHSNSTSKPASKAAAPCTKAPVVRKGG